MIDRIKRKIYAVIKNLVREGIVQTADEVKDIGIKLQERATDTTCEYIEKNLLNIPSKLNPSDILDFAISKVSIEGTIMEFGVYTGKSINHLAVRFPDQKIYGFDSFEGLPERWRDGYDQEAFSLKGELPTVEKNVKLIKGWFDSSLRTFLSEHKVDKISLLHIDCDLYNSTTTIFNHLQNHIQVGTIIVFDEYFNYPGWQQGEFKAFQEFVSTYDVAYSYLTYNRKHEQVVVRVDQIANNQ